MDRVNDTLNKKRTLKKIRKDFLKKGPEDQEPSNLNNPLDFSSDTRGFFMNPSASSPERDKQVEVETHLLPPEAGLESIKIEGELFSKIVTLNFTEESSTLIPWSRNLGNEIYGDLDFTAWSMRIQEYLSTYPQIIDKYFELLLRSQEPEVLIGLRKAKAKAAIICKHIESTYAFRKLVFFSNQKTTKFLSSSFSEKFLKELGYSLEGFVNTIKINGYPNLFENDFSIYVGNAGNFLDSLVQSGEFLQEEPEYQTYCFCQDGSKKEFISQCISIVEPTSEGVFTSVYIILKQVVPSEFIESMTCEETCSGLDSDLYIQGNEDL